MPSKSVLPSEQLASSAGLRVVVLESSEAVSCQNAVALLTESVMSCCIPLWQLAGVAPRQQCVLQDSIPFFVPQKNLTPLLT